MRILPKIYVFLIALLLFVAVSFNAHALSEISVAVEIFGQNVQAGHIVSLNNENYVLSFSTTNPNLFGVVTDDPVLSIQSQNIENPYFITTSGEAYVKVTGLNGNIEEGDFVTASSIPGVGQKATNSGQVLGRALESITFEDPNDQTEILVFINITSAFIGEEIAKDLIGVLRSGFQVPFLTPLASLRYILAAVIAVVSFFIGFSSFGRISTNSIEALGRNPLASRIIKSAIFLNFIFTIGIMGIGLVISYLILTF